MLKIHLPRHINSRVFTDSCHCPTHDYFCIGKSCLILMMKMSLSQANHSTGISKGYIDVGINPIDEDVPIWPVCMQYFSSVEMHMLFLFDCHWLVVGATCRWFPDGANKHFPWLPLMLHIESPVNPLLSLYIIWALNAVRFWHVEHFQKLGMGETSNS